MKNDIAIIGKNSYLAQKYIENTKHNIIFSCDRLTEALDENQDPIFIINFGFNRALYNGPYNISLDVDKKNMEKIKTFRTNVIYVTMSTRAVYDSSESTILKENSPLTTDSTRLYSLNKIKIEEQIRNTLPGQHLILRLGNVVEQAPGRRTWMGTALDTLIRRNKITLNYSKKSIRDFITIESFTSALDRIISARLRGTYNLGSGHGTEVGALARWIIEGYGSGEVEALDSIEGDSFILNVDRLRKKIGDICPPSAIRIAARHAGMHLRDLRDKDQK